MTAYINSRGEIIGELPDLEFTCPVCGSHCWGGNTLEAVCHSSDDPNARPQFDAQGLPIACRFMWKRSQDHLYFRPRKKRQ